MIKNKLGYKLQFCKYVHTHVNTTFCAQIGKGNNWKENKPKCYQMLILGMVGIFQTIHKGYIIYNVKNKYNRRIVSTLAQEGSEPGFNQAPYLPVSPAPHKVSFFSVGENVSQILLAFSFLRL